MTTKNAFFIVLILIIASCSQQNQGENSSSTADSLAVSEPAAPESVAAVSIWDNISVRATADPDGKYLTRMNLGETLTYLGEEATAKDGKIYVKVKLNDGTEGWTRTEFVIPEAEPAAFVNESDLYNRPDLLTKSSYKFSLMDIVAVSETSDDWVKVVGKPTGETWLKDGWVKMDNLSYEDIDIATAKFAQAALGADDPIVALEEILTNSDLNASVFAEHIQDKIDELYAEDESDGGEMVVDSTSVE